MDNEVKNISRVKIWVIIVSFILPIVGLITYFIYRKNNNKTARLSLLASIVGLIILIIYKQQK